MKDERFYQLYGTLVNKYYQLEKELREIEKENAEGKVIGLSTVQRGDFIAEGLKEWEGRYREGEGFNKWEPVERKEE